MAVAEGPDHIVRYVNAAFCLLICKAAEAVVGSPFAQLVPDRDGCLALFDRVYRTGDAEIYTEQERAETASNPNSMYWSYAMWPVLAAEENAPPLGVMLQVTEAAPFLQHAAAMNQALVLSAVRQHELTEAGETLNHQLQAEMVVRKTAQEALIRVEKLASVGRMAAVTAHEINNPLAAAMNTLFLLQHEPELSESSRQYLKIADGELKRIAYITRQTLGFYQESSAPAAFKVTALLDSVISLMQSKITSARVMVQKQCDDGLQMRGVFGELRQVLTNLLANSLDAVEEDGRVTLCAWNTASPDDGQRSITITVADTGHGIAAETLPHLFEPFFTTKGSIGNGLGLWVCKQIVEKHSGSIQVQSTTEGPQRGTTFSVTLPAEAA
ncbi:MAG: ATP-binding protein [Acidobacteriaceae bacterium]